MIPSGQFEHMDITLSMRDLENLLELAVKIDTDFDIVVCGPVLEYKSGCAKRLREDYC
jgi:hypothetical protein